ncbi:hypothetical protein SGPA1_21668 [Streptomyces misionensis JCM 4497]
MRARAPAPKAGAEAARAATAPGDRRRCAVGPARRAFPADASGEDRGEGAEAGRTRAHERGRGPVTGADESVAVRGLVRHSQPARGRRVRGRPLDHRAAAGLAGRVRAARRRGHRCRRGRRAGTATGLRSAGRPHRPLLGAGDRRLRPDGRLGTAAGRRRGAVGGLRPGDRRAGGQGGAVTREGHAALARRRGDRPGPGLRRPRGTGPDRRPRRTAAGGRRARADRRRLRARPRGARPAGPRRTAGAVVAAGPGSLPAGVRARDRGRGAGAGRRAAAEGVLDVRRLHRGHHERLRPLRRALLPPGPTASADRRVGAGAVRGGDGGGRGRGTGHGLALRPDRPPCAGRPAGADRRGGGPRLHRHGAGRGRRSAGVGRRHGHPGVHPARHRRRPGARRAPGDRVRPVRRRRRGGQPGRRRPDRRTVRLLDPPAGHGGRRRPGPRRRPAGRPADHPALRHRPPRPLTLGSFVWIRPDQGAGSGACRCKAEEGVDAMGVPPRERSRAWGSWRPTTTRQMCVPDPASPTGSRREALGVLSRDVGDTRAGCLNR